MGLLDRVGRLVRAQVTHWVAQAEDPERILEQSLQEMQGDLLELRQAVAQAIATQRRAERQHAEAEAGASDWQRRAFMAVENGQDAFAKEALAKRQSYLASAQSLAQQIVQQRSLIVQLKQNLRLLDGRLVEAKAKKDLYLARARSAAAANRMNELLDRTHPDGSGAIFERMEEKIMTLEAQAELAAERQQDPVAERFARLESETAVEADLRSLQGPSAPAPRSPQLPPW
jgi:phage shock protein A